MAYYYSLRGWLEVEPDGFSQMVQVFQSLQQRCEKDPKLSLYLKGWCWSDTPINWTRYLFYGADVSEEGLRFFKEVLSQIAHCGLNLSGYFHAQGEDGERNYTYQMVDDQVFLEESLPKLEVT